MLHIHSLTCVEMHIAPGSWLKNQWQNSRLQQTAEASKRLACAFNHTLVCCLFPLFIFLFYRKPKIWKDCIYSSKKIEKPSQITQHFKCQGKVAWILTKNILNMRPYWIKRIYHMTLSIKQKGFDKYIAFTLTKTTKHYANAVPSNLKQIWSWIYIANIRLT